MIHRRYSEASSMLAFHVYPITQIRGWINALQSYPMPGWFWKAPMKTKQTNYIRVKSLNAVNRLLGVFGWSLKNSTLGRETIIVEMNRGDRRLIVTSPL